jgi:hypothetical protein
VGPKYLFSQILIENVYRESVNVRNLILVRGV